MPRRRLTEEQIEAMRKRILDVALDILHDSGPEAISIRTISSKLGISHMAIYTYFNNRSELIHALNERLQRWLRSKYEKIMEEAEAGDVKTVLESLLAYYAEMSRDDPTMYRFLLVEPLTSRKFVDQPKLMEGNLQHLSNLIELGIGRGVFKKRDHLLAAGTVFNLVNAPLILFHSGRMVDPTVRDRMFEEGLRVAIEYLVG